MGFLGAVQQPSHAGSRESRIDEQSSVCHVSVGQDLCQLGLQLYFQHYSHVMLGNM